MKSLKRQYYQAKDAFKKNNGQYRKLCKFFEEMERILGNRPTVDPQDMIDSVAVGDEMMDGTEEEGEGTEQSSDSYMPTATEYAEHPVKIEYPSYTIPVTVGSKCALHLHAFMLFIIPTRLIHPPVLRCLSYM